MLSQLKALRMFLVCISVQLLTFSLGHANAAIQQVDEGSDVQTAKAQQPVASLVKVRLPIDGRSAAATRQTLQKIIDSYSNVVQVKQRPVVVIEFDNSRGATGQGSSLGACIDLARFLSSSEVNRLKTVAYIPAREVNSTDGAEAQAGQLNGHAVLVALSAEQLDMHPQVTLGAAGIDESGVDGFVTAAYRDVVSKRLTVPVPVAIGMLDKDQGLYNVETDDGKSIFVNGDKLQKLETEGDAVNTKTLADSGQFAQLSGQQLLDLGLIRHASKSRTGLADHLGIPIESLSATSENDQQWRAVRIKLPKYVDSTTLQWVTRALDPKVSADKVNLIIIEFDSLAGDEDACLLLARRLVAYDSDEIKTVAFINKEAAGPAALLALSCDHVVMTDEGILGGAYEPEIALSKLDDLKSAAAGIANDLGKDPALLQAMLDPQMEVIRFRDKKTGQERLLTQQQRDDLVDAENWLPLGPQSISEPLTASAAEKQGIARLLVASFDELKSFYQLEDEPELLTPTEVDRWLHQVALLLASPFVAPWLLFMAMFFLFNEMSQPGLGIPGFLGTLCLILYFWSQHLDGNADWLEILLFAVGVVFVMVELFVLPGMGIFGIGGLIMIVVSIVLAAQTFVFPTNSEEFGQLPKSLFALLGAFAGLGTAMFLVGTVLPRTPLFRRLMLEPPNRSEDEFPDGRDPESVVNWSHLVGRKGITITNLAPSGKAKLAGQLMDVMSDGRLIEKGQEIEVVEVSGNRVIVTPAES